MSEKLLIDLMIGLQVPKRIVMDKIGCVNGGRILDM